MLPRKKLLLNVLYFQITFVGAAKNCYAYLGSVNDFGFTYAQHVARSYVDGELSTVSAYAERVSFLGPDAQDALLQKFATSCDVIVVGSDTMHDVAHKFAQIYSNKKFIIVGHIPRPVITNFAFTYVRAYQGKYIAGIIAASHPGVKRLGYVGSVRTPSAFPNVNAFYLGAASVNPNIMVYNINTDSWFAPELERVAGLQLFSLHDVDLISFDSDSDELCKVAAEQGKLSIGYKSDAAIAHGDSVLTSVLFDWRQTFKKLVMAAGAGGTAWDAAYQAYEYDGFDENAISLGTYSTAVGAETRAKAKTVVDAFAAKNDNVFCSPTGGFRDTQGTWRSPKNGGNCLQMESADSDLQDMDWLHGGITDLGYLTVKSSIHVCYAFSGPISDMGWTYYQNLARSYVDVRVAGCTSEYVENVALMDESGQKSVLDMFVAKGCDNVVLAHEVFSDIANEYAGKHPNINWIGAGLRFNQGHTNLATAHIRSYQGKFVAGMIAASQPGVKRLGYVMALRISEPMRDANAFFLGAKSVNPDIKMTVLTVGSFYAPREERIAGLRLYHLYGADVLTYDSDSDEICKLAAEEGRLVIGHKSDCTLRHGDTSLASTILNWNDIFETLVQAEKDGLWKAKWQSLEFVGFEASGLTLGTYSSKVAMATRTIAEAKVAEFAAGTDRVFCKNFTDINGKIHAPQGADGCFTSAQLLSELDWLHEGIQDLGVMPMPKDKVHSCYAFFGPITDFGWTYAHNFARNWVDAHLAGSTSEHVENVYFMDRAGQNATLDGFVAKGCDNVVLGSGTFSEIANEYAGRYPNINWIGAALWFNLGHTNLATTFIRAYQGKFIAGMIAAAQPGVKKLGYVMAMRISEPMRDANAFYLGAKFVNPDIKMTILTVGSFYAPREERIAGLRLYHVHGADVIAYDSDSDEVCKLAAEEGKLSIGHKSDCTVSWGNSNLASTIFDWRASFELLIKATKDGLWSAFWQTVEFSGFEWNALSMGTYSTRVDMATRYKAEAKIAEFAAGTDRVFCKNFTDTTGKIHIPAGADGCFTDVQLVSQLAWLHDGIEDLGEMVVPKSCPRGQRRDALVAGLCVDCTAGSYADTEDQTQCQKCHSGLFASSNRATACEICPAGTFAMGAGSASCDACLNGTYSTGGSSACTDCPVGKYRSGGSAAMLSSCLICDIASYSSESGSSKCNSCRERRTTRYPSATTEVDCICAEGYYSHGSDCFRCGEGMSCDIGTTVPQQVAGFWIETKANVSRRLATSMEYSVFKCHSVQECPAGPPGTCARGRTGKACAVCMDMHYKGDGGECNVCGESGPVPAILAVCAAVFAVLALYFFSAVDPSTQMLTMVTIIACMGQLATMVQALGAIKNIQISWVEPVKSFLNVLGLLTLDLDVIRTTCLLGVDSPPVKYLSRLLVYPFLVLSLAIMLGIMQFVGRRVDPDRVINSQGVLILIFYISLAVSSLLPFHCVPNPNGTSAMSTNPSVICWTSEGNHLSMVVMGVFGVLSYPVFILGLVAWITWQFPKRIAAGGGIQLVKRYRWLFSRFKLETYFYGLIYLARNLCIALVPIVFAFSSHAQILATTFVLVLTAMIQVLLWPWRTTFANLSDMLINIMLILIMPGMCLLLPESDAKQKEVVAWYLQSLLFVALVSVFGTIAYMAYRHFWPSASYGAFLSHHKGGAANLARLFKMKLAPLTALEIFLDSDELESLDLLYDTVRSHVKNLILLLTKETLSRMWCCGEITTAVKNNVPIITVPCDDYVPPTDEDLEIIEKGWNNEQWATLATMGVMPEDMKAAYKHIRALPQLRFSRFAPFAEQLAAIEEIAKACRFSTGNFRSEQTVARTDILLLGAVNDAEAMCACQILREECQKLTQVQCSVASTSDEAGKFSDSAEYVVVILTKGLFKDSGFARSLLSFARRGRYPIKGAKEAAAEVVTILADQTFDFPNGEQRIEAARIALRGSGQESDLQVLVDCYEVTLKILAIHINFCASWKVCSVQIEELCRRFKKYGRVSSGNVASKINSQRPSIIDTRSSKDCIQADEKPSAAEIDGHTDVHPSSIGCDSDSTDSLFDHKNMIETRL
eukprot:TRINITY_DN973_c0_g1_i8.p1 TRINITY_DN973_c0_g1~~TRINITY_DN973_c0_g1_i8.p1  ORF type:complete len:2075 (+),score=300.87 TRINITY_DN973_c0_g1_i8:111-6335(+)